MEPIRKPVVNNQLEALNGLQRVVECFRYTIACIEHWISPEGHIREWLQRNLLLGAWMIVPAIFVMPVVGFILWQLNAWLSMFNGILGKLIVLPVLFLLAFVVIKTALTLLRR